MKINILFSLFILFIFTGCGALQVYVKPNTSFNKDTTITVIGAEDRSGTKGQIEYLLLTRGFNVVSESTAKNAIKYKESIKSTDTINYEHIAEVYAIKEINSVYILESHYSSYWDVFYWTYRNFSAKITDLNTGEIILTAQFSGDRSVDSVLNELMKKIDKQLNNKR